MVKDLTILKIGKEAMRKVLATTRHGKGVVRLFFATCSGKDAKEEFQRRRIEKFLATTWLSKEVLRNVLPTTWFGSK
jgi:hypothetical protein